MDNPTQACSGQPPAAATPDLTGRTLAEFRVLRRLGGGGMGEVYLAEQLSLGRMVALKILRPDLVASQPEAMQRFQAEGRAVARATHANIVQVYAIGEAEGVCYMALEYVEGRNLAEFLARKGPPELLLALSIMRQVAAALQRAGELGIIHRDIKPQNILLTRKGEVKVADFGLSRCLAGEGPLHLTRSGQTMGTPLYMSPEQAEGKPLDHRTDIYSFGVTCYHMLAGQPPFRGEGPIEVALKHVRAEPEPLSRVRPDLPEALCAIVHRMMAKDPADRYQTARDLIRDIVRLREGLAGQTCLQPLAGSLEATNVPLPPAGGAPVTAVEGQAGGAAMLAAPPAGARAWWARRRLLVAASLLMALALGVACGWLRRQIAGPAPAALVPLADEEVIEPRKKEDTLVAGVELHLQDPANNTGTALPLCRELGAYYLQQDRPGDAERFFTRLEGLKGPGTVPYHVLGRLGRGIALALQSRAKESNDCFRSLPAVGPRRWNLDTVIAATGLRGDAEWRYWLLRAVDYNRRNGIAPTDFPPWLQRALAGRT
jgi:serine/threonine-protein kinase